MGFDPWADSDTFGDSSGHPLPEGAPTPAWAIEQNARRFRGQRYESWESRAACGPGRGVNPNIFHPSHAGGRYAAREAKKVCAECPVREECLILGLLIDDQYGDRFGIFGGLTAAEREQQFGEADVA